MLYLNWKKKKENNEKIQEKAKAFHDGKFNSQNTNSSGVHDELPDMRIKSHSLGS